MRTAKLLSTEGEEVDICLVEEVLVRAFKSSDPIVDHDSSDFCGTIHFQYLLSRELLLGRNTGSYMRRIDDDALVFMGLTAEVPDVDTVHTASITTARLNCIACHGINPFGTNSIFSFQRRRSGR